MTAPVKFLFEDDFAGDARRGARHVAPAVHEAAIEAARAEAFRQGADVGQARSAAEIAGRIAVASERIAIGLAELARGLGAIEARLEAESVEVAVAVATKLAPELIAAEPFAEVAALAAGCFRQLVAAPHVVVRVDETTYETAQARLKEIAHMQGFEGRLVVLAEPTLGAGDCRIEWADGGVTRDRSATAAAIGEAVSRYVAARRQQSSGGSSDE
ncbi:MAG: flagellar assembly protein FliH [Hyphomicrobiales bacterium]|nr:flagellar assembly protein FliH [Hyphomicrobiales bacterium]